jgi:hypothetical protein
MPSSYPYAAVQPLRRGEHTYSRVIVPRFSLPHTVDIYRNADIRLDAGDRVPVGLTDMTPLYRRVRCWVQPETAQQVLEFQRLALPIIHQVTFFMNPGIINGDMCSIEFSSEPKQTIHGISCIFCRDESNTPHYILDAMGTSNWFLSGDLFPVFGERAWLYERGGESCTVSVEVNSDGFEEA